MTEPNALYYGDNLDILRHHIGTATVDLVYLDPPFNSKRDYNVLFKEKSGEASPAQIEAFTDTWQWDRSTEQTYRSLLTEAPGSVAQMVSSLRDFIGPNDMMAYLVMMAVRLIELHRVLRPTGSLYLHCDPTASHYLRVLLDGIFGKENFRNEIIWRRTGAHGPRRSFGPVHDTILFYSKSGKYTFNIVRKPYMRQHVERRYTKDEAGQSKFTSGGNVLTGAGATKGESGQPWRGFDPSKKNRHWAVPGFLAEQMPPEFAGLGVLAKLDTLYEAGLIDIKEGSAWPTPVRYLGTADGQPLQDIWAYQPYTEGTVYGNTAGIDAEVAWLGPTDPERIGYPTQKPLGLLERIILSSSNPDDLVLDPFCGCGTAVVAAQKLGRHWCGIDITHLSIALMRNRLRDHFGDSAAFEVIGEPEDIGSARMLAESDRYQFQWWALSLVKAKPIDGKEKKGADRGIDGVINFVDDNAGRLRRCLVQVKSGHVQRRDIGDFVTAINREKAQMGIFVSLDPSTGPMRQETIAAGWYHSKGWQRDYPKVQILTIEELLAGKLPEMPPTRQTFQRSERIAVPGQRQEVMVGFGEE